MPFFTDADEVYKYVGGVFRAGSDHPEVGPKMGQSFIASRMFPSEATMSISMGWFALQ